MLLFYMYYNGSHHHDKMRRLILSNITGNSVFFNLFFYINWRKDGERTRKHIRPLRQGNKPSKNNINGAGENEQPFRQKKMK